MAQQLAERRCVMRTFVVCLMTTLFLASSAVYAALPVWQIPNPQLTGFQTTTPDLLLPEIKANNPSSSMAALNQQFRAWQTIRSSA